jgi:hypothetical protein
VPAKGAPRKKTAKSAADPLVKEPDGDRDEAIEAVVETAESLFRDRASPLFGSHVKQTLKRKRPNFSETFHGYRSFNELLEDAQRRGLLRLEKDDRSGGYVVVGLGDQA